MATLTSLKLTAAQKSVNLPAVQLRRNKLLLRLAELSIPVQRDR